MSRFGEGYRSFAFALLCLAVLAASLAMVWPFLPALLWATVLSVLAAPLYARLRRKLRPNLSALIATFVALAFIGIPLFLVGLVFFVQGTAFLRGVVSSSPGGDGSLSFNSVVAEADRALKPLLGHLSPNFSLSDWVTQNRETLIRGITGPLGAAAADAIRAVVTLVIAFLTMFFMLRDGHRLREPASELLPLPADRSAQILDRIGSTIQGVFVGVVLIGLVQGLLATVGYLTLGIPSALTWGAVTTILCMIPLLGAPLVYVPLGLMLIFQGRTVEGASLLGFGLLVVSQIDNVLKPFVIGARIEMHPIVVFFSLLGGVLALGPVGLMAGPMLLAVLLGLQDVIRERLRSEPPVESAMSASSGA